MTPFRSGFSPEEWQEFLGVGEQITLHEGEVLLRRGQPPQSMFIVQSGVLEAVDPRSSPPTVLGAIPAGSVIGELSALDGAPVSVDVRVRQTATCVRLELTTLSTLLSKAPLLDAAFHRGVARDLIVRTRSLTGSAVRGALGTGSAHEDANPLRLAATEAAPARLMHALLAEGLDPHTATAIIDQGRGKTRIPVHGDRIRLGSGDDVEVLLTDLRIAPLHAELVCSDGQWRVVSRDDRAVVVNGVSVSSAPSPPGTELQVGRYRLSFDGTEVVIHPTSPPFYLHVEDLGRDIGDTSILDGVRFSAMSGEVIALIGPSGAGKTTLLDALRGNRDRGGVRMDGVPLEQVLAGVPSVIGEVPQDDIVLPELTVEESLLAASRLRLPGATASERQAVVNRVIEALGLQGVRNSRIGDPERRGISGGQRKRVNIAQEVLTDDARVLFLDEPTSGLDPRSAADIGRLARRLADSGKIVVMVTHDLSESVLSQVDHLLVLVPGGRLAWFGPTSQAPGHFGAIHAAGIFDRLSDRTPEEWVAHFRSSDAAETWVARRQTIGEEQLTTAAAPEATALPGILRQISVFAGRNLKAKLRDRASLLVLLAQPLIVAAVMLLVFPRPTSGLIFLLMLSCFWFGMSASVRELIVDQVLWRREARLGLSSAGWVAAKAAVVGVAVALQCAALTAVALVSSGLERAGFEALPLLGVAVLTGWAGVGTGLLASAVWRRSEAAVGTIVLLLIPQIAFSGLLMPLEQVHALARALSWVTPVRYAFHLALVCGDTVEYFKLGRWFTRPVSGELYNMGLRASGEGGTGMPVSTLVAFLSVWTLACWILAGWRVSTRQRR